ncbi:MAG: aspartate aminotransferase family protein [Chloroflexota bacterium]
MRSAEPQWGGNFSGAEDVARLRRQALDHLWIHTRQWNELAEPGGLLIFERAEGVRLYDVEGREYLDAMSGLWVVNAGHGRRELAQVAYEQMQKLAYINTFAYASVPAIKLAAKLAEIAPGDLNHVFFVNSGSEAVETALKMARQYHHLNGEPKRYKFIYRRGSYHGQTFGAMTVNGARYLDRTYFEPLVPGGVAVVNVDSYRYPENLTYEGYNLYCAQAVAEAIEQEGPNTVAAVIAEPISTSAGVHVPLPIYWQKLREICDRYGVLLIADEVINGFGRTGRWFGIEHFGVVPDIMTVAKGLGSGYVPIAAAIAGPKVFDRFKGERRHAFQHGITFGSHPVAAAVALKNLEIIEREGLVERAAEMGRYLGVRLEGLKEHPIVGDVRGIGLLWAVELVKDRRTKARFAESDEIGRRLTPKLLKRGVLTRAGEIIQIAPPLTIEKADIDRVIEALDEAIGELEREIL